MKITLQDDAEALLADVADVMSHDPAVQMLGVEMSPERAARVLLYLGVAVWRGLRASGVSPLRAPVEKLEEIMPGLITNVYDPSVWPTETRDGKTVRVIPPGVGSGDALGRYDEVTGKGIASATTESGQEASEEGSGEADPSGEDSDEDDEPSEGRPLVVDGSYVEVDPGDGDLLVPLVHTRYRTPHDEDGMTPPKEWTPGRKPRGPEAAIWGYYRERGIPRYTAPVDGDVPVAVVYWAPGGVPDEIDPPSDLPSGWRVIQQDLGGHGVAHQVIPPWGVTDVDLRRRALTRAVKGGVDANGMPYRGEGFDIGRPVRDRLAGAVVVS